MESSIKRREPTILKLVTTYNNLCAELQSMIWLQKAPPGAIPPPPIPSKGIFNWMLIVIFGRMLGLRSVTLPPHVGLLMRVYVRELGLCWKLIVVMKKKEDWPVARCCVLCNMANVWYVLQVSTFFGTFSHTFWMLFSFLPFITLQYGPKDNVVDTV